METNTAIIILPGMKDPSDDDQLDLYPLEVLEKGSFLLLRDIAKGLKKDNETGDANWGIHDDGTGIWSGDMGPEEISQDG